MITYPLAPRNGSKMKTQSLVLSLIEIYFEIPITTMPMAEYFSNKIRNVKICFAKMMNRNATMESVSYSCCFSCKCIPVYGTMNLSDV